MMFIGKLLMSSCGLKTTIKLNDEKYHKKIFNKKWRSKNLARVQEN